MKDSRHIFIFDTVLWSEDGNTLLEKHTTTIRRVHLQTARNVIAKKYPRPYFTELYSVR